MKSFFKLFVLSSMFVACGAQPKQEETAASPAVVKSIAQPEATSTPSDIPATLNLDAAVNLPACTKFMEGVLAFAREEHEFYLCENLAWAALDVRGEKGNAGAQGIDGVGIQGVQGAQGIAGTSGSNGTNGTNGVDNHIAIRWECSAVLNDNAAYFGTPSLSIEYAVNVTTYGDVTIFARTVYGVGGQWLTERQLPRDHPDAATAKIQNILNWVGGSIAGSIWTFTLDRNANQMLVRYDDPDMTSLGGVYQKTGACTKMTY